MAGTLPRKHVIDVHDGGWRAVRTGQSSDHLLRAPEGPITVLPDLRTIRKRVLLVVFDFPPRRTSGVYRPTALVKYLPRYGWQPTVLTINDTTGNVKDRSLLDRIPAGIKVERTSYVRLDAWEAPASALLQYFLRSSHAESTPTHLAPSLRVNTGGNLSRSLGDILRLAAAAIRTGVYFPDETAGWIPFGFARALQMLLRERFDAVLTTVPPRSAHVIGLWLKLITGVPWVAEFRDPWVVPDADRPIFELQRQAPRRNKWLHKRILRHADAIITVTAQHAAELCRYFDTPAEKIEHVSNGFDEEDFAVARTAGPPMFDPSKLHFCHFGTIYPGFSGGFFPVLAGLLQENPQYRDLVRLHLVGYPDDEVAKRYAEGELRDVIQLQSFVQHSAALQMMRESSCLLLFYGHEYTSRSSMPGKLYEYLRVGRPILAIACEGGVKDLIERARAGRVLRPDDHDGIRRTLITAIQTCERNRSIDVAGDPSVVAQYRYDHLAGRIAAILDRAGNS